MNCKKIKPLLSDYINKELSKDLEIELKNHIDKCEKCMQEIDFLKKYFIEIKNIKPINAPSDLLDKIHIRLNKKSNFMSFIKKLFIPLQIKIPLQIITVAAAALFIILLFDPVKQQLINETKLAEKPKEEIELKKEQDSAKEQDKLLVKSNDAESVKKDIKKPKVEKKVKATKLYTVSLLIVSDKNELDNSSLRKRGIPPTEATTDIKTTLNDKHKYLIEVILKNGGKIISPKNYENLTSLDQLSINIPEEKYKIFIEELNKIGITTLKETEDKEKSINSYEIELKLNK